MMKPYKVILPFFDSLQISITHPDPTHLAPNI